MLLCETRLKTLIVINIKVNGKKLSLSFKSIHKRKKRYDISLDTGFAPLKEKLSNWIEEYKIKNGE